MGATKLAISWRIARQYKQLEGITVGIIGWTDSSGDNFKLIGGKVQKEEDGLRSDGISEDEILEEQDYTDNELPL